MSFYLCILIITVLPQQINKTQINILLNQQTFEKTNINSRPFFSKLHFGRWGFFSKFVSSKLDAHKLFGRYSGKRTKTISRFKIETILVDVYLKKNYVYDTTMLFLNGCRITQVLKLFWNTCSLFDLDLSQQRLSVLFHQFKKYILS